MGGWVKWMDYLCCSPGLILCLVGSAAQTYHTPPRRAHLSYIPTKYYTMLCRAMQCYAVLWYAMPHCTKVTSFVTSDGLLNIGIANPLALRGSLAFLNLRTSPKNYRDIWALCIPCEYFYGPRIVSFTHCWMQALKGRCKNFVLFTIVCARWFDFSYIFFAI